jgi:ketopantoate reductase
MNGYIARLGEEYKIATPVTTTLWRLSDLRLKLIRDNAVGQ